MKNQITFLFAFLCLCVSAFGQHTISGKISDPSSTPLVGVSIAEKGTSTGTVTDIDGNYELKVSSSTATIIFSYVSYKAQTITLEGQTTLNITLEEDNLLDGVQVVGSRSYNRSATSSPVAVDVIDVAKLTSTNGRTDINQILQYAAPSFNATKQSGSDGADHVDPASLRGLGPDQTLVLINGKRRHQSSLVNLFGTRGRGNTGTDMNAIPVSAIKRIEVLRDGASAQYGSDAIAGVINIVLKDQTDGLTGAVTTGAYSTGIGDDYAQQIFDTQDGWEPDLYNIDGTNRLDGEEKSFDGSTTKVELNYGLELGKEGGYVNLTTEYMTKANTLRPSYSWRQGYGSAAVDQFQFMVNALYPVSENTDIYAFGGQSGRETDAYAFSRDAPGPDGDSRATALYPNGFTPRITSKISDNAYTAGVRHKMENGWNADFSHTYGYNYFHYYIKETNNATLGVASPTNFDAGGHSLAMNVTSLDFSKYMEDIASGLNVAFGTEYRSENFQIFAGEEGSYAIYDVNGIAITNPAIQTPYTNEYGQQPSGGSQGFPGYTPANEIDRNRSNVSFYGDVELNATDEFMIAGAVRLENYSDFGNTFNYKIATRYNVMESLAFRASISSGFRAPSLAQIHYNLLFNNIVGNRSVRTLLASNTSTVAKAFGIEELKQETAQNIAGGFTFETGNFTATMDGYLINVKDRIILTDNFDASSLNVGADAAKFFVNGIDTKTSGVDLVLNYQYELSNGSIDVGFAGNINKTEIESINSGNLNVYTFFSPFSEAYLEAAAPDYKFSFNVGYSSEKFDALVSWTQFSEIVLQDFQWVDTPPTTASEAEALFPGATDVYEARGTLDASVSYKFNKNFKLTLGGTNILNTYPTPQFDGWTDQGGFNDSVQMGSDGAYFFARIGFGF